MADYDEISVTKESLWYIDNYVLIRDYYDRTVSRIAARCIRMGNLPWRIILFTLILLMS